MVGWQHALGGFGPLIAGGLTTCLFSGKKGLQGWAGGAFSLRRPIFMAVALLGPCLIFLVAALLVWLQTGTSPGWSQVGRSPEFPGFSPFTFFLFNLVFFGLGEEMGWRGFALPHLQRRFSALSASLLLTLLWAGWHIPLFLYRPGYVQMGPGDAVGWVFSLLTGSVLLGWLFNSSRGSLLACALFHAAVDVAFLADGSGNAQMMNLMGMLITVWGVVTLLVFKGKNLAREKRVKA